MLEENLVDKKLSQEPNGYNIEVLVSLVMEELVDNHNPLLDIKDKEVIVFGGKFDPNFA